MVHLQAPVGVMTVCIRGKVKLRIPAKQDSVSEIADGFGEMADRKYC
jgi:hypothetical protein